MASSGFIKKSFGPGDLAPVSGVYLITHLTGHREPHEAMIIRGEQLASCRICKMAVSFEILQATSHMTHDWDFAGPKALVTRSKRPEFSDLRSSPRYGIELPIVVELRRPEGSLLLQGHANDLSEGGIGAIIEGKLAEPKLSVVLRIPIGQPLQPVTINAHLRHRRGMLHGFKFVRMDHAQREAICRLLRDRTSS